MPYSLVKRNYIFGGKCGLHIHGSRVGQAKTSMKQAAVLTLKMEATFT
jgi:hypothetical protein